MYVAKLLIFDVSFVMRTLPEVWDKEQSHIFTVGARARTCMRSDVLSGGIVAERWQVRVFMSIVPMPATGVSGMGTRWVSRIVNGSDRWVIGPHEWMPIARTSLGPVLEKILDLLDGICGRTRFQGSH
jgi:hypothetical protein